MHGSPLHTYPGWYPINFKKFSSEQNVAGTILYEICVPRLKTNNSPWRDLVLLIVSRRQTRPHGYLNICFRFFLVLNSLNCNAIGHSYAFLRTKYLWGEERVAVLIVFDLLWCLWIVYVMQREQLLRRNNSARSDYRRLWIFTIYNYSVEFWCGFNVILFPFICLQMRWKRLKTIITRVYE